MSFFDRFRPAPKISARDVDPDALTVIHRLHRAGFVAYLVGGGVGDDADLEVGDVEGVLLLHGVHPSCPPSFCTKSTKERQNIQNVLEIIGIWEYNRVNTSHYPYYNTKLVD